MAQDQRPLELILARNLITKLSTPRFLVDGEGELVFYNEAAGAFWASASRRSGAWAPEEWRQRLRALRPRGRRLDVEHIPLDDRPDARAPTAPASGSARSAAPSTASR